jgi:phosphopantothenoylcysteine decarboxylase/phosphopantothenate--cysteine ligase
MSKKEGPLVLDLERTDDILLALGHRKQQQKVIGFALEDGSGTESALTKMERKNLDGIVLNSLSESGAGFGTGTNKITWLDTRNTIKSFDLKNKRDVAKDIWNEILSL